jgi:hypothetical protein
MDHPGKRAPLWSQPFLSVQLRHESQVICDEAA